MTAPTLLELARRCETEEPSIELDADIAAALGWKIKEPPSNPNWLHLRIAACGWPPGEKDWRYVPCYGSSLDAAVSLVPSGYAFILSTNPNKSPAYVRMAPKAVGSGNAIMARTPALALCAAALRAHASLQVQR